LIGINFEWTGGQITKKGSEGWFAELLEYHRQNVIVQVLGDNKKEYAQLARWGNYAKRTAIAVLMNKKKNADFTVQRCKMLVDIGLVPLEFYLYGSDTSDKVGEHQDVNSTQSITGTMRKCDAVTHIYSNNCNPITRIDNNKCDPVTHCDIKQYGHL
jgi:hypothetical protein